MIPSAVAFVQERFPLAVTVPISFILFTAPFMISNQNGYDYVVGTVTTFLLLLSARMADDLKSIQLDAVRHPERGLPSGTISSNKLQNALALIFIFVIIINIFSVHKIIGLIGLYLFYSIFFHIKHRIHLLLRPLFSNGIFLAIPVYATGFELARTQATILLLGLFAWGSAVAHEYAHEVHADSESNKPSESYTNLLGARYAATVSALAFVPPLLSALLFWQLSARPIFFIITLSLTTLYLIYLSYRLIRTPSTDRAQPFYIHGFLFFVLPYGAFILDRLVKGL